MADHPNPTQVLQRTSRIALLLTVLVTGLLVWESQSPKASPQRTTSRQRFSVRSNPEPAVRVEKKLEPLPVMAPTPPPPPPAPALPPIVRVDPATLHLSEIIIDPADPAARFAVIDGVAVRAGETICGHRVKEVLPDRVLIGEEGTMVLLPSRKEH